MFWWRPLLANLVAVEHLMAVAWPALSGDVTVEDLLFGFAAGYYCCDSGSQVDSNILKLYQLDRPSVGSVGTSLCSPICACV